MKAFEDAEKRAGGQTKTISPKVEAVPLSDGSVIKADAQLFGQPSATVYACAIILSEAACEKLKKEAAAVQWVMDAFDHLKAIGFNEAAKPQLQKVGIQADEGVTVLAKFPDAAKWRYWDRKRSVRTLA